MAVQSGLSPSPARVQLLDTQMRRRLAESLDYIGDYVRANTGIAFADVPAIGRRLESGAVSSWMFCLFSELVAELSTDPPGDIVRLVDDVSASALLPSGEGVIAFGSGHPETWWNHVQVLLDTDRQSPFRLRAPSPDAFRGCERDIRAGFALMHRADLELHDEVAGLLRTIVLGSATAASVGFNGVSTFFNWGATVLNADVQRSAIEVVDLLVHESSHLLLFGLSSRAALTQNSGKERYSSPVRSDERPIDGIFHACFVTTRVHLAMNRMIKNCRLDADEMQAARSARAENEKAARESLDLLKRHAEPTPTGERVLADLIDYWA
jgi:hypothetical protein